MCEEGLEVEGPWELLFYNNKKKEKIIDHYLNVNKELSVNLWWCQQDIFLINLLSATNIVQHQLNNTILAIP